ncbi:DUF1491 family protein [Sphingomicrobium sp. XHP0235]|uniref:DUF1491 family protein n=1 Tax=Sphingomicrobium aquimarinum TaxID=3133971 RepID=UPI0031FEBC04
MSDTLPAELEVRALMRAAEATGGSAMLLSKGDRDRGDIFLLLCERGVTKALVGREYTAAGQRRWRILASADPDRPGAVDETIAKRRAIDPDLWVVELDLADPTRYAAEILEIS